MPLRRVVEGGRHIENGIAQELALQKVSSGRDVQDLMERDLEIKRLLADGMSLAKISDALGIGYSTVANARSHIKTKLGVTRISELVQLPGPVLTGNAENLRQRCLADLTSTPDGALMLPGS